MKKGFTLIELVVVIVIISILVVIAVPRFGKSINKGREGTVLSNLNAIRSALRIYYADNEGYPTDDLSSLLPKYITKIPEIYLPGTGHPASNSIRVVSSTSDISDSGLISYVNDPTSSSFGSVFIDCAHAHSTNKIYTNY